MKLLQQGGTCSEEAQTMEYFIFYAFLAGVCFAEDYSQPCVGPCHLLNLDVCRAGVEIHKMKLTLGEKLPMPL